MRRFIAFYFPQYHPIPENDEWWGPGFTDWENVRRARPRFRGHLQPREAGELGYYDLRDPNTRQRQADLARTHAVDGFCYFHYWFHGRRLLNEPFDAVLASGKPDFPFCLCWANEGWTRSWDGHSDIRLVAQTYCIDDDARHFAWLAQAFKDPRYIRVDGKPLFLVYRVSDLPHPRDTTTLWRAEAQRQGLGDLYLCRVEAYPADREDPTDLGFDASVEFQPNFSRLGQRIGQAPLQRAIRRLFKPDGGLRMDRAYDYGEYVDLALGQPEVPFKRYRTVTPGWDNSPRRAVEATILHNSTPELYKRFMEGVLQQISPFSSDENLVFINAWNEWAEGNYLEPDARWGAAFLDAQLEASGRHHQ